MTWIQHFWRLVLCSTYGIKSVDAIEIHSNGNWETKYTIELIWVSMNFFEWFIPSKLGRSNLITLTFYNIYAIDMIETYSWIVALNLNLFGAFTFPYCTCTRRGQGLRCMPWIDFSTIIGDWKLSQIPFDKH